MVASNAIAVRVAAPPVPARSFGLFSVAPPEAPTDSHALMGLGWESLACGRLPVWGDPCWNPDLAGGAKTVAACVPQHGGDAFTVYRYVNWSGGQLADGQAAAEATLAVGEQSAVEQYLWTRLLASDTGLGAGASPVLALALVEQALADNYMGQGVIHMTPTAATMLGGEYLERQGNRLYTIAGTPVVVGGGYVKGAPDTIIGTGVVVVRRGPVETLGAIDRNVNDVLALVERNYVIAWDCGAWSATYGS